MILIDAFVRISGATKLHTVHSSFTHNDIGTLNSIKPWFHNQQWYLKIQGFPSERCRLSTIVLHGYTSFYAQLPLLIQVDKLNQFEF